MLTDLAIVDIPFPQIAASLGNRRAPKLRQVIEALRARKQPTLEEMVHRLGCMQTRSRAAVILKELAPDRLAQTSLQESPAGGVYGDALIKSAIQAVETIAPLDLEYIECLCSDGYEYMQYLPPEPWGYPMNWDEWDEMSSDPSQYNESMELYLFITAIRLAEDEVLDNAADHFGWDLGFDELGEMPDPDWDQLFQRLDESGLSCFKHGIDACLYSTGNPYFDFNAYDEDIPTNLPEFSIAGVRKLQKYHEEAKPILADLNQSQDQFACDPSLAGKLMQLMVECSPQRIKIGPERPRTLAELWAPEEDRPVIDPFYGPLDRAPEDLMEEMEEEE